MVQDSIKSTQPHILCHYSGKGKKNEQDIFILLRPKTNCYQIESLILSVLRSSQYYKKFFWLEYMANLPGTFLAFRNVMNMHYRHRYYFTIHGKESFTPSMRKKFEQRFHRNFDNSNIISSFEALKQLNISEVELAQYWLCTKEGVHDYIEGQTISKICDDNNEELFIINYDIPSLMMQHHEGTNCAVLMFRTLLSYQQFHILIKEVIHNIFVHVSEFTDMYKDNKILQNYFFLTENELLHGGYKRFFHYSNGPFEQLHDGIDFLYDSDGNHIALKDMTFAHYLHTHNVDMLELIASLRNPIGLFDINNTWEEHSLYSATYHMNYTQALSMFKNMRSQLITDNRITKAV